jgi:hypothetical protein
MRYLIVAFVALVSSCTSAPAPSGGDDTVPGRPGRAADSGTIIGQSRADDSLQLVRLEQEARQIATASGCSAADQCRAAPVGDRPCGGPRDFVVYCTATTDTSALQTKLDELIRAERAFNQKYELVSTCELRMPPELTLSGGSCRAAAR